MGLKVIVEAEINPTEDDDKVMDAILKIFPDVECNVNSGVIQCTGKDISNFAKLLKEQRIRDAARHVLLSGMSENKIEVWLNKQAATVGRVSFSVGNAPLGDIHVIFISDNVSHLIDSVAPDTAQKQFHN